MIEVMAIEIIIIEIMGEALVSRPAACFVLPPADRLMRTSAAPSL
jgi:hypothetical protein